MSAAPPLLQLAAVSVSRPAEDGRRQTILNDVSLSVRAGEVLAIVGPSGGGKSTLLRLLNRLLEADSGAVMFAGEDVRSIQPPMLRARLPLVAQKPFLFPGTVKDNLLTVSRLQNTTPPDFSDSSAKEILKLCQVDESWLERDGQRLSIGQQQRVCLARALFGPCQVLLFDEPTSALDRPTADQLARTFRQLATEKKLAVVIVTHDLRVAELCANRVAILLEGSLVETGPAEQVLHHPASAAAQRFLVAEPVNGHGGQS